MRRACVLTDAINCVHHLSCIQPTMRESGGTHLDIDTASLELGIGEVGS